MIRQRQIERNMMRKYLVDRAEIRQITDKALKQGFTRQQAYTLVKYVMYKRYGGDMPNLKNWERELLAGSKAIDFINAL